MKLTISRITGFSLIEVTLALGIAAFCLLAIMACSQQVWRRTRLPFNKQPIPISLPRSPPICEQLPLLRATSPRYGIAIPATGNATHTIFLQDDGTAGAQDADAVPSQNPRYRATITFAAPADSSQKTATGVTILLTWPALADPVASATAEQIHRRLRGLYGT